MIHMNEDTITDLKQFIAGAITQQTSDIHYTVQQIDSRLSSLASSMKVLDQKVDDGFAAIAEMLDASSNEAEARLNNHETRLTRLETKAI